MPTVSDERFAALRGQGHVGSTSDMVLQWLQANGATSKAVPDAWKEMLAANGFSGQRNDAWFQFLGSLGYEGTLNDRELAFWSSGGSVSSDGVRITDQPDTWSGIEGAIASFTVIATSGNGSPLSYKWQENLTGTWTDVTDGDRLSGSTIFTLTLASVQVSDNNRSFRCRITNSFNSIFSQPAYVRVIGAKWFIIDQLGNRQITEDPDNDFILDERSI